MSALQQFFRLGRGMRILVNLPDAPNDRILDADHAMRIAFSSALAAEIDAGRIAVSLDGGCKTFLFQAIRSDAGHRPTLGLADSVGSWREPRFDVLRDEHGCKYFQVQLIDRSTSGLLAEFEFADSREQTLTEQALSLLWQNSLMVDRLVHKVHLRGRTENDPRWMTLELLLGEPI